MRPDWNAKTKGLEFFLSLYPWFISALKTPKYCFLSTVKLVLILSFYVSIKIFTRRPRSNLVVPIKPNKSYRRSACVSVLKGVFLQWVADKYTVAKYKFPAGACFVLNWTVALSRFACFYRVKILFLSYVPAKKKRKTKCLVSKSEHTAAQFVESDNNSVCA